MTRLNLLLLTLSLLISSSAHANMRGPTELDGDVVISQLTPAATAAVTLVHEKLTIVAPRLREKEWDDYFATVSATYTLQNDGESLTLPLVFLATSLRSPKVVVNGKGVSAVEHTMNPAQRAEYQRAVRAQKIDERFLQERLDGGMAALFEVALQKGTNTVSFSYEQEVKFNENDSRYGAPKHERTELRIEYLLYPAKAWKRADGFRLDVEVAVPDIVNEGWIWDTLWKPHVECAPQLKGSYDEKSRMTTFVGEFDKFPVDVLTVDVRRGEKR